VDWMMVWCFLDRGWWEWCRRVRSREGNKNGLMEDVRGFSIRRRRKLKMDDEKVCRIA